MDLNNYDTKDAASEGAWLHLREPEGELLYADDEKQLPSRLKLLGSDSDEFQRHWRRLMDGQRKVSGKSGGFKTAAEVEAEAVSLLVSVTVGAENIMWGGELLEFTSANMRKLYDQFPWAAEQASTFMTNRGAYLENSQRS